jgi:hypothetical protein
MSLRITQVCDRCKKEREIQGASIDHVKKDGWRVIPSNRKFGESRGEQPQLCTDCLDFIDHVIKCGPNTTIHIPYEEASA